MNLRSFFAVRITHYTTALFLFTAVGIERLSAAEPASAVIESTGSRRILQLIDASPYSKPDKEVLKKGIVVVPSLDTQTPCEVARVSQETIDVQVKNTAADLERSVAFLFAITRCLQQNTAEFLSSARFEGLPAPDRGALETCLRDAVEEYSAQTLETLFAKHKHTVAMPSEVARSVTNAEYRQLLILAAKTIQHPRIELKRPTHHTVQVGESVISIARMYKVSPGSLIAANPGIVSGLVRVGQVLFVPLPAPATPAQRALSIKEGPERQSAKL